MSRTLLLLLFVAILGIPPSAEGDQTARSPDFELRTWAMSGAEPAGGEPGMEVCWQVTGVRRDAIAEMRRAPVESAKTGDKRGKYMHPEAFGLPETMATDYSEERERGKQVLRETFRKGR